MSKFKVKQRVVAKENGKVGVIRAREVNHVGKHTEIKYLVDFGDGIENWKVLKRSDLERCAEKSQPSPYHVRVYEVGDGKLLTLAALVEKEYNYSIGENGVVKTTGKTLSIGFSIYNGVDKFNENIGRKIAIHRCKKNPFTTMMSPFSGEFNMETVESIMSVKAKYIIDNIDNFYRPNE